MKVLIIALATTSILILTGCASESHKAMQVEKSASAQTAANYQGPKHPIMVSNFDNKSGFMQDYS